LELKRMANEGFPCTYPAFIEERMRQHQEIYGPNPEGEDWITVPLGKWLAVNTLRRAWKTRYGKGYHAGYTTGRRHEEVKLKEAKLR
jgi:hypothetical protein